jgi:hypothetical protein
MATERPAAEQEKLFMNAASQSCSIVYFGWPAGNANYQLISACHVEPVSKHILQA